MKEELLIFGDKGIEKRYFHDTRNPIQGYNKGLILLTSYVVLGYDFEQAILSILNLHLLVQ